jgi:hypothetical protein
VNSEFRKLESAGEFFANCEKFITAPCGIAEKRVREKFAKKPGALTSDNLPKDLNLCSI